MRGTVAKRLRRLSGIKTNESKLEVIKSAHGCVTTPEGSQRIDKLTSEGITKLKDFWKKKLTYDTLISNTFKWSGPKRLYKDMKKAHIQGGV